MITREKDPHECPISDDDRGCITEMVRKYRENERRTNRNINGNETDDLSIGFKQFMVALSLRERHLIETSSKIHWFHYKL